VRIAILTGSVSRQGGGVFEAVARLSRALQCLPGMEVHVLGLRDAGTDADAEAWWPISVTAGRLRGPRTFGYSAAYGRMLTELRPDIIHVHGLWMYASVAALRWAARTGAAYVVSPHGMLDRWALDNSALSKRIAGMLYQDRHLHRSACLHAVGDSEYRSIRAFGLRNPVCVIPNGVDAPMPNVHVPTWRAALPRDAKILLYLGRLHPKKGVPSLLQAWASTVPPTQPWHLVIAGWDDRGHRAELEAQVKLLRLSERVHFVGPQFGTDKDATFQAATAFVLPSMSEGLPVAVLEAWSHGLPVLMTSQCNLPEGYEAGAALRIEPSPPMIAQQLARLLVMSRSDMRAIGEAGRRLVAERFAWPMLAADMACVYRWLLRHGALPGCVRLSDAWPPNAANGLDELQTAR
jgi:poly(glycerol-phosphate) alpha-glucosyltransferase